jgi:hypothetical protein
MARITKTDFEKPYEMVYEIAYTHAYDYALIRRGPRVIGNTILVDEARSLMQDCVTHVHNYLNTLQTKFVEEMRKLDAEYKPGNDVRQLVQDIAEEAAEDAWNKGQQERALLRKRVRDQIHDKVANAERQITPGAYL